LIIGILTLIAKNRSEMRDTINEHLNEMNGLSGLSVEGIEIEAGPVGENLAKFRRSSSRSDQLLDRRTLCGRQQLLVQGSQTNCAPAIHKSGKNREKRSTAELLDQKLFITDPTFQVNPEAALDPNSKRL
jgi:hypothetical protein